VTITIGIDPGLHGAIALLDSKGGLIDVYDMPVIDKRVSAADLATFEPWGSDDYGTVVLEDVHAIPRARGMSSSAMFSFGRSKGVIEGLFAMAGKPIVYVAPQRWKKALGLPADKGAARQMATNLWPSKASAFARVKDDGRAEAALIAHWWLQ
jgi:crossover junction endodeoxyribonuclease RuvC